MKYEERVVCFIDILGFKSIIDNTIDADGEEVEEKTDGLYSALHSILEFKRLEEKFPELDIKKNVTQFSDSVVISFEVSLDEIFSTLVDILYIIMSLIDYRILIRGGISYGKVLHNDEQIFGPAMVEAYRLESTISKFPRVIVSEEIIKGLSALKGTGKYRYELEHIFELLQQDDDGFWYIEYIAGAQSEFDYPETYPLYLFDLSEMITVGLKSEDKCTRDKYVWLKNKYNIVVQEIKKNCNKSDIDPEIKSAYESLPVFEGE